MCTGTSDCTTILYPGVYIGQSNTWIACRIVDVPGAYERREAPACAEGSQSLHTGSVRVILLLVQIVVMWNLGCFKAI